jgi:hypothetical protein
MERDGSPTTNYTLGYSDMPPEAQRAILSDTFPKRKETLAEIAYNAALGFVIEVEPRLPRWGFGEILFTTDLEESATRFAKYLLWKRANEAAFQSEGELQIVTLAVRQALVNCNTPEKIFLNDIFPPLTVVYATRKDWSALARRQNDGIIVRELPKEKRNWNLV